MEEQKREEQKREEQKREEQKREEQKRSIPNMEVISPSPPKKKLTKDPHNHEDCDMYDEHKKRHLELHKALGELYWDYSKHHLYTPKDITVVELMEWSFEQTKNPDE